MAGGSSTKKTSIRSPCGLPYSALKILISQFLSLSQREFLINRRRRERRYNFQAIFQGPYFEFSFNDVNLRLIGGLKKLILKKQKKILNYQLA